MTKGGNCWNTMSYLMAFCFIFNIICSQSDGISLVPFLNTHQTLTPRPSIHTFIYNEDPIKKFQEDEHIKLWAETWADAGWNPVILTEKDAQKDPEYQQYIRKLSSAKVPEKRFNRFLRYAAMSTVGGGWYSEPYILPIKPDRFGKNVLDLPNEGKFTMYSNLLPELLSGNAHEWKKLSFWMLEQPHNNDVRILQDILRDNPGLYIIHDSIVTTEYIFDSEMRYEVCDLLDDKLGVKVSYQVAKKGGYTRKMYYEAVKSSLKSVEIKCKHPIMHTFFEPAYEQHDELLNILDEWKKAWKGAGWRPKVLTIRDARRHPDFEKFESAFNNAGYDIGDYKRMSFYRWLAMATSGGGWMSDFDTFPLNSDPFQDGLVLPNDGILTSYTNHVPCLVSGSADEWNRVSHLMLMSYLLHTTEYWSDTLALQEIQRTINGTLYMMNTITADDPYKNDSSILRGGGDAIIDPYDLKTRCHLTDGMRAIHFSPASCKRAGFCHEQRGASAAKWVEAWKQYCLDPKIKSS